MCRYVTTTLTYINTVKRFSDGISGWILLRNTEIGMMWDIKERAEKKSEELEKELAAVLEGTLSGLQELDEFLDAVEKLTFTSLHVFMKNSDVLHLPTGISLDLVQAIITAAQLSYPFQMVIMMTTDDFYVPQLQNLDIILAQLSTNIMISQLICDKMEKRYNKADAGLRSEIDLTKRRMHVQHMEEKWTIRGQAQEVSVMLTSWFLCCSSSSDWRPIPVNETSIDLDVDLSEDDIQKMLTHIKQLHSIR